MSKIKISEGVYKENKMTVAEAIDNYIESISKISKDSYKDTNSSELCEYLSESFPQYTWYKNSSQSPFDIYSIDGRIAIENKMVNTTYSKRTHTHTVKDRLLANATLYPDKVRVKDVLPLKESMHISDDVLDSFMDVLVVCIDVCPKTNAVVSHKIVDGSYWGIDYDTYLGCKNFFKLMNNKSAHRLLLNLMSELYPDNKFIKMLTDNNDNSVEFYFRKLLYVKNPILYKEASHWGELYTEMH